MEKTPATIWRRTVVGADKSWVVFGHGTRLIFTDGASNLTAQARGITGTVHVGSADG